MEGLYGSLQHGTISFSTSQEMSPLLSMQKCEHYWWYLIKKAPKEHSTNDVVYFGRAVGWLIAYDIILGAYFDDLLTEGENLGDSGKIVRIAISVLDKWQNTKQKMDTTLLPANLARDVSL